MNLFEHLLHQLEGAMPVPTNYGWFHLMFFGIMIVGTVLLCCLFKDCSAKAFKTITLISWIVIVLLEVYKQLIFSFSLTDGVPVWDYQWYAFPYQLCSTPLYILPFVIFLKDGKLRDAMMSYMMTFSLFGGIVVFLYPNDVFIETIGINIQTMIHHGLQIALGIFIMAYNRKKLNFKFWVKSVPVFAVLVCIAFVLNVGVYNLGIEETFNMFYIGPYYECTLPILSTIYKNIPYVCFILLYILGFVLVSYIIYIVGKAICKLTGKSKKDEKTAD